MVTLDRADTWKISVYGRDHGVPHFHIEGQEFRCSIAIATLEVIIGAAPSGVLRATKDWAGGHQAELAAKWQELNE